MKITRVKIKNYRAIREFDQKFDSITSFIGYNGGGKSSILKAIEWFFENFPLEDTDYFTPNGDANRANKISVEVTFGDLSNTDRENFGMYARGNEMTLHREVIRGNQSKLFGQAIVCPKIDAIRNINGIVDKRKSLRTLSESKEFSALKFDGKPPTKTEIDEALDRWEKDPLNAKYLKKKGPEDATHFFGAVGTNKLKIHGGFIFVPAAPDLSGQFDSGNKGSAIELLVGNLMKDAVGDSIMKWQSDHKDVLDELEQTVKDAATDGLKTQSEKVNAHLESYLPGASFKLDVSLDEWKPKATPVAQPSIGRSGREFLLDSQGHGIQRATLLALLQAIAENRTEPTNTSAQAHSSTLIICIEEPEVYQHPVQARMLAASFKLAAKQGNIQFIFATHSPYFVEPTFLHSTYRVSPGSNGSTILGAKPTSYFLQKNQFGELEKYFSKATIEGLFSRACLLVEGDTDRLVFEGLRSLTTKRTLAESGVTVIDVDGGNNLWTISSIMSSYGVPVYLLHDGDNAPNRARQRAINKSGGSNPSEEELDAAVQKILTSWKKGVDDFLKRAHMEDLGEGLEDFTWGNGHKTAKHCAILADDLEAVLEEWPSFVAKALEHNLGEDLRSTKKAGSYARAIAESDMADCPQSLLDIVDAVVALCDQEEINA